MGSSYKSEAQLRHAQEVRDNLAAERVSAERMQLSNKIVMAIVDHVSAAIIRPGPTPEERECYVMAQELRDISPQLIKLVSEILRIEREEGE